MNSVKQLVSLNAAGCIMDLSQTQGQQPNLRKHRMPFVMYAADFLKSRLLRGATPRSVTTRRATPECLRNAPVLCVNGPNGISPTTERYRVMSRDAGGAPLVDQRLYFTIALAG
jgi:hypothetical protein